LAGLLPLLRARAARAGSAADLLFGVEARAGSPFRGDSAGLLTLSPGGVRGRAEAFLDFGLGRDAMVDFDVVAHRGAGEGGTGVQTVASETQFLGRGLHTVSWRPELSDQRGTYVLRLRASDSSGQSVQYREAMPGRSRVELAPVVRLIGVDAAFTQRSYAPGDRATLQIAADAEALVVELLHCGPEPDPTYANNEMKGVPVGDPIALDWRASSDKATQVGLGIGSWPSGVYCAQLTSSDGRMGFAPFVLRPRRPDRRIAVIVPTSTWHAYNFYDRDGDGFGDSWYVSSATRSIDLTRPHLTRGVPCRYRSYDLAFLRWLAAGGKQVDFYADDDLERFESGDELRAAYDLVVFPGHSEYVTEHAFDVVERYRDLGGNLLFLSANNFFRRVDRGGGRLRLVGLWRDFGRPEAALCGVQYVASDRGKRQAAYTVTGADLAPWAFEGTGLANGSRFGLYGIEIDSTTPSSPPGTKVLARIPDLLGPGRTAEMTYYESPSGGRVFSAGAMNFGGQIALWPETLQLLENVWARLAPAGG
jgi:hypothetical protein